MIVSNEYQKSYLKLQKEIEDLANSDKLKNVAGIYYNIANTENIAPIQVALNYGNLELAKLFRKVDEKSQNLSVVELIGYVASKAIESNEIRNYLFSQINGEDINKNLVFADDHKGRPLLHLAVFKVDVDLVQRLLNNPLVDLASKDEDGNTVLDVVDKLLDSVWEKTLLFQLV